MFKPLTFVDFGDDESLFICRIFFSNTNDRPSHFKFKILTLKSLLV